MTDKETNLTPLENVLLEAEMYFMKKGRQDYEVYDRAKDYLISLANLRLTEGERAGREFVAHFLMDRMPIEAGHLYPTLEAALKADTSV